MCVKSECDANFKTIRQINISLPIARDCVCVCVAGTAEYSQWPHSQPCSYKAALIYMQMKVINRTTAAVLPADEELYGRTVKPTLIYSQEIKHKRSDVTSLCPRGSVIFRSTEQEG